MKSERIISALLLLCILNGILIAQGKNGDDNCFFIQITDPQFGMFENNEGFEKETVLYEKAVEHVNKLKPDFVVITGDFVHNSNNKSQIEEFLKITAKIHPEIPVYLSPGNHDVGQEPDKQSLQTYIDTYGYDRFSFNLKGYFFVGLNTSLIKGDMPRCEKKQYKWLKKELKEGQDFSQVVLFCHYPFFINAFDEPEKYSNIALEDREKYLSLFEEYNVDAVFSGHYHNNAFAKYGDIQFVTTSAIGKPLGEAPSGIRIIRIYNGKIKHEFFGLDEIPETVSFE